MYSDVRRAIARKTKYQFAEGTPMQISFAALSFSPYGSPSAFRAKKQKSHTLITESAQSTLCNNKRGLKDDNI